MDTNTVQEQIRENFPDLKINQISKIGEGTGNIAYEVNENLIFRFPKSPASVTQLAQEIKLQPILKSFATKPYPNFTYLPLDHSFVGYKKLSGRALIHLTNSFNSWDILAEEIAHFLNKLHSIPPSELVDLDLLVEDKSPADWLAHSYPYFEKTKYLIPAKYHYSIKIFFDTTAPTQIVIPVLCHNDLGIEHILIENDHVSAIIDWGGAAIADPACDFARLYRDLGPDLLAQVLAKYNIAAGNKINLRARAMFYGRCLIFEDLYCGIREEEYLTKSLLALDWMFEIEPSCEDSPRRQ